MGNKRETFLRTVINHIFGDTKCEFPKISQFELEYAGLEEEVYRVYKLLGGTMEQIPINYKWDIKCPDFCLELDEERHFNRYRALTLDSPIYWDYKWFSVQNYKRYCSDKEILCLKSASFGSYWKNNSTEKAFLESSEEGNLSDNGSSRWRQRAFYDFLKDINSIIRNKPVIRISIYDEYNDIPVNKMLYTEDYKTTKEYLLHILKDFV